MANKMKLDNLKGKIDSCIEDYYDLFDTKNLTNIDIENKINEVGILIEHINQRIQYTETRITRTVTFSVTLIGIGMAFFVGTTQYQGFSFICGLVTSGLFILTGTVAALIHILQVNPQYPFRSLKNDWKWFYPQILEKKYAPTFFVKECETKYLEKRLMHLKGLIKYASNLIYENEIERLMTDIQQLYLLHANEKYKNCFLSSLRKVIVLGLSLTFISLLFLFGFIINDKFTEHNNDKIQASEVLIQVTPKTNENH